MNQEDTRPIDRFFFIIEFNELRALLYHDLEACMYVLGVPFKERTRRETHCCQLEGEASPPSSASLRGKYYYSPSSLNENFPGKFPSSWQQ